MVRVFTAIRYEPNIAVIASSAQDAAQIIGEAVRNSK